MEAQLQRPTHGHHHYEEDPHDNAGLHSVIEGEGEGEHNHHGEKKSVLKMVKDKAKKVKDTIKKHGQGHEHDYRHDHISEGEDDEDEQMVNAPEVHGAPMYESAFISGTNLPVQTNVNLEKPTGPQEDRYKPNVRNEVYPRPEFKNPLRTSPNAIDLEEASVAEPMVKIGPLVDLEEDPHSPKSHPGNVPPSNYQTKVIDPTGEGGKEAEVAPLVRRLDNLYIHDKSESNPKSERRSYTESATEYGYEVAEKLAPVYEKVAGAGRAVMPKVQRGGGAEHEGRDTVGKDTDKGVSVKEYLAEKFSPGDEDKALSEVITDAFQRKKEGIRRRGEEPVKESQDVAARLGTGKENKRDAVAAGGENSGAGVVARLKGAVSSWLGKSSGSQTTQHSLGQECASDVSPASGGGLSKEEVSNQQTRLQESGN